MVRTVYIAGPMRGLPKHNFPAFDRAATFFRAADFRVLNPADFDRSMGLTEDTPDEEITTDILRKCMARDLEAITQCTDIALLRGWHESRGVRPEVMLADILDLTFWAESVHPRYVQVSKHHVVATLGLKVLTSLPGLVKDVAERVVL